MSLRLKTNRLRKGIPLIFLGCVVIALGFRWAQRSFPVHLADLETHAFHSVKFYDRHGNLLQEVLSESESKSIHVPIDDVSPYFLNAVIAVEDRRFYRHRGVDVRSVIRALYQNIRSLKVISGASTIPMQLARMRRPGPRTLFKKIGEVFYAFRMEAGMHKREILQAYVNRLPMGGNLYGIESGAQAYFGISSRDLTLAQATFLASIPNSPNRLNPYHHAREIKKRQRIVLESMIEQNMIDESRIAGVLKEDVCLKPQSASFLAPHFVFHLMRRLPDDIHEVRTTLDCDLQQMVQEQIQKVLFALEGFHVTNAAALLIDNHTGEVLAYAGSADYFDTENEGENDGIQALRQPGSAIKPFLYQLALENGHTPATVIPDIPVHFRMPAGVYSPKNYSEQFRGPVRLREALANSLNIPAVRVLAGIGVHEFLNRLHDYGFQSLQREADHYGVGLVLGNGEVTLYELARAYVCLARNGRWTRIREILGIHGKPVHVPLTDRTISSRMFAFLITDILSDRFARTAEFGFNTVLELPFPCAVKTGTSFRFCDNWTLGYTRDYTLGVWAGNFNHEPMQKVSGISGAGPIFARIMQMLYHDKQPPKKWTAPEGLTRVRICPLSGKRPNAACPCAMEEWIPNQDMAVFQKTECDMHVLIRDDIRAAVPEQYHSWAEPLGLKVEAPHASPSEFAIIHPPDGALYYRLSNLAPEYQSIRFEASSPGEADRVNWYLNGRLLRSTDDPHAFLWQIEPGTFHLKAVSAKKPEIWHSVGFEVK